MPILKSDYNSENEIDNDLHPVLFDCDGLPYVVPEDENLLADHFQQKWMDQIASK